MRRRRRWLLLLLLHHRTRSAGHHHRPRTARHHSVLLLLLLGHHHHALVPRSATRSTHRHHAGLIARARWTRASTGSRSHHADAAVRRILRKEKFLHFADGGQLFFSVLSLLRCQIFIRDFDS